MGRKEGVSELLKLIKMNVHQNECIYNHFMVGTEKLLVKQVALLQSPANFTINPPLANQFHQKDKTKPAPNRHKPALKLNLSIPP